MIRIFLKTFFRFFCIFFILVDFILLFVTLGFAITKNQYLFHSLTTLVISIILSILSFFAILLTLDEFEKNNEKFVKKTFNFLLEKGYKETKLSINCQSCFSFVKDEICFNLNIELDCIWFTVKRNSKLIDEQYNITSILDEKQFEFLSLSYSTMVKIKIIATIVEKNYDKIYLFLQHNRNQSTIN